MNESNGCSFGWLYYRQKQFTVIAKTRVYQSVGTLAIQLGGHSLGPLALMGGHAIGQGIGASGLAYSALKRPELKKSSWRNIKKQAYRYKDFPVFSTWTALFNTASLQFAPIMFIAIFGATVTGLYALTLRMLTQLVVFFCQKHQQQNVRVI